MTQDEINLQEWKNPENWSGRFFKVYFSKKDSRVFVPARWWPKWGVGTFPLSLRHGVVNLGHRRGAICLFVFWLVICLIMFLIGLTADFIEH
jgi:uncharacterized membrane protein